MRGEFGAIGGAGILAAPVAVVEQSGLRPTLPQGHAQGGQRQGGVELGAKGPADPLSAVEVQHHR